MTIGLLKLMLWEIFNGKIPLEEAGKRFSYPCTKPQMADTFLEEFPAQIFRAIKQKNSVGGLGDWDYWIVKTDALGNIQWQNAIGGFSSDILYSVQQTGEGGYILGGTSSSPMSGDKTENSNGTHDYWIVKTDALGNIQWQNTIGGNSSDQLYSVQQTTDGGYILGGWSSSNISGDKTENGIGGTDYWIVKTDVSGNIQWQNTIGGIGSEGMGSGVGVTVQQAIDGGYIIGGCSLSNIFRRQDRKPDRWILLW
jgi:hypothetical protein